MATSPSNPTPVICQHCGAHVSMRVARAGLKFKCPKCGVVLETAALFSQHAKHPSIQPAGVVAFDPEPAVDMSAIAVDDAGSSPPSDGGSTSSGDSDELKMEPVRARPEATAIVSATMLQANRESEQRKQVELPEWPLYTGVFSFPFYPATATRWAAMSIWLMVSLWLLQTAIVLLGQGTLGAGALAVFCVAALSVIGCLGFAWLSSALVTVTADSAEGVDQIEDWPTSVFPKTVADPFYIVNGLTIAALPGFLIGQLLSGVAPILGWLLPATGVLVAFPPLLIAMLENGSPLVPISDRVWQSMRRQFSVWATFYAESIPLLAITATIAGWLIVVGGFPGLVVAAVLIVGGLFIYFRLIGRLAWACADGDLEDPTPQNTTTRQLPGEAPR